MRHMSAVVFALGLEGEFATELSSLADVALGSPEELSGELVDGLLARR